MKPEHGIAEKLESAAYDLVYIVYGIVYTFWDFLFRPVAFKRLTSTVRLEANGADGAKAAPLPYTLPITYVAFCLLVFFLYVPQIVGYEPSNYPLLGTALHERIKFLDQFAAAVKGARLSQIVILLIPIITSVGLHAAFVRVFLGVFRLKTTFEAQLGIDAYADGTTLLAFCVFMSPQLIREPMKVFLMEKGSAGAQALFAGVLSLAIAAFGLIVFRYFSYVHHSCNARRDQWGQVIVSASAALVLSAVILWAAVAFWLPFILPAS